MTMTATPSSVAAGSVTFTVKNTGTIKHEMVVLKTDGTALTINSDGKVSESTSVGEIGDIEPGKTASVTLGPEGRAVRARLQHQGPLQDGHAHRLHGHVTSCPRRST